MFLNPQMQEGIQRYFIDQNILLLPKNNGYQRYDVNTELLNIVADDLELLA